MYLHNIRENLIRIFFFKFFNVRENFFSDELSFIKNN